MQLHINPGSETPVSRQIERQIARAIRERSLRPGERLQRAEELAAGLVVSPQAVRRAYRGLLAAGLCDRSPGEDLRVSRRRPLSGSGEGTPSLLDPAVPALELQAAREAQAGLLPPPVVTGRSWRICGRSLCAGALSGDLYQVVTLDDDAVVLVVGDVAGKGLAAGLMVAAVQALLPETVAVRRPHLVLEELNRRLSHLLRRREFVALAVARLEPTSRMLELANAGLPDPYLLSAGGAGEALEVPGERLPLGLKPGIRYARLSVAIEPGDRVLMLTDGIPEAIGHDGSPLGYERLRRLLATVLRESESAAAEPSVSLADRLIAGAAATTGGLVGDDWTVATLELRPPAGSPECS